MKHHIFNHHVLLSFIFGALIGAALFVLGAMDDAPGLSFIGLSAAFLFFMRGLYHTGLIHRGYHIPIILFVFSAAGLLLPVILYLDHEIESLSAVTVIGWTVGCAMILSGLLRIRYLKKASREVLEK